MPHNLRTRDLDILYLNCLIGVRGRSRTLGHIVHACQVENPGRHILSVRRIGTNQRSKEVCIQEDDPVLEYPDLGYIQIKRGPLFTSRVHTSSSERYRRGFVHSSLTIFDPLSRARINAEESRFDLRIDSLIFRQIVDSIYNPKYDSLTSAWEKVSSRSSVGRTFHPTMALVITPQYEYPLLMYKTLSLGYVTREREKYIVHIPPAALPYVETLEQRGLTPRMMEEMR
ncbi:MAG: hypothetical protein KAI07_11045 [Deltaproteobacteria bacterium]|nr:hypothetical protein [Deltaproteobacteria bacterium]